MTASPLAYLALILFVPLSSLAFVLLRPPAAVATVLISATLFLPEHVEFDAPLIPPMGKTTISSLCALLGVLFTSRARVFGAPPDRYIAALSGSLLVANVFTTLTNRDPLAYGSTFIQGLTLHDALSDTVRIMLSAVIPFFLGFSLFRTRQDLIELLRVLVVAALVYVPFILVELRMSPQFHRWVYGFHQHEFVQTIRESGYRPMVFMQHGLALANFMFAGLVAATALAKLRVPILGLPAWIAALTLGVILMLCKSMAALLYGFVAVPIVLFWRPRSQIRLAVFLALVVLAYPALRSTNAFPTATLVDLSARVAQDRAESLGQRFGHEDRLVKKANERPLFGWGGFGRNRIYDAEGVDQSVTDGAWIGTYGSGGAAGFICIFGLLTIPVFRARSSLRRLVAAPERVLLATMALLVAFADIDLLPNGLFSALPLFFAGALGGAAREACVPVQLDQCECPRAAAVSTQRRAGSLDGPGHRCLDAGFRATESLAPRSFALCSSGAALRSRAAFGAARGCSLRGGARARSRRSPSQRRRYR